MNIANSFKREAGRNSDVAEYTANVRAQRNSYVPFDWWDYPLAKLNNLQVARVLGVHPRTLCRYVSEGKLPKPIKVGREIRWTVQQLRDSYFGQLIPGVSVALPMNPNTGPAAALHVQFVEGSAL